MLIYRAYIGIKSGIRCMVSQNRIAEGFIGILSQRMIIYSYHFLEKIGDCEKIGPGDRTLKPLIIELSR